MEGDITPADKIAKRVKEHSATLIVDDAHGFGVLGKTGRGVCEQFQLLEDDLYCLVIPLGKAVGSMGAVVAGPDDLIESLVQFARTYKYSTALPPAISIATLRSLEILEKENWRTEKLKKLISFFIQESQTRNLPLVSDDLTPIKSFLIGDNKKTLQIQQLLFEKGLYVSAIRPPTVPVNTARIRISLNCNHDEADLVRLLDLMAEYHA